MSESFLPMGRLEWTLLVLLSVLWGGSFFFVGVAVRELPPFTIVALRVGLAALTLLLVVHLMGLRMPSTPRIWLAFFGMGFINNMVPFSLIVWGQTHIASGLASILNATTPLLTLVVAHLFTVDEKMTRSRLVGLMVGFTGVISIIGPDVLSGIGQDVAAQCAILGAALAYAFGGVFGRRFRRLNVQPMVAATGQVTASTVLIVPVALILDRPWNLTPPGTGTWAAVIALAVLSTALAYILYFRILATAGATNLLLVTFLIPVSAILLGVAFLNEMLEPKHFAGMALIGLGLALVDGRPARLLMRTKAQST
ncbi:DMT family transporter [Marinobacter fonticola]|uniref:DMT family transporter n=1 Tax=Marinobacter fonticola TaxID=2603215 RepID=UPI0019310C8C|nr:DMT family transporter [Marinobacter fonticola]